MSLTVQLANGFVKSVEDVHEKIIQQLSEKFNLEVKAVRSVFNDVLTDRKYLPKMKPQKTAPKPPNKDGTAKQQKRNRSPYQVFCDHNRDHAKYLLRNYKNERTFTKKDGTKETIDKTNFTEDGQPNFGDTTKKLASMWAHVSNKEFEKWKKKAEEVNSANQEDTDNNENDEDNEELSSEESEEVEEEPEPPQPKKKQTYKKKVPPRKK